MFKRIVIAALGVVGVLGSAGCADDYGYGRSDYGYYAGAPGFGYYDDIGYPGSFGWYGDYYYPGTGVYVYDRYRRPYRWNGTQQRYWQGRRTYAGQAGRGDRRELRQNWGGFQQDRRGFRQQRQGDRRALEAGLIDRDQFRTQRRDARQTYRQGQRQDGRAASRGGRRTRRN